HGERVRHRKRIRVRRMVLRYALREARGLHQELADDLRQERQDADAAAAGRGRHDRSDRPEPAVLSRVETLRRGIGSRAVSARAARVARREAPAGSAQPDRGVVRQVPETVCRAYFAAVISASTAHVSGSWQSNVSRYSRTSSAGYCFEIASTAAPIFAASGLTLSS